MRGLIHIIFLTFGHTKKCNFSSQCIIQFKMWWFYNFSTLKSKNLGILENFSRWQNVTICDRWSIIQWIYSFSIIWLFQLLLMTSFYHCNTKSILFYVSSVRDNENTIFLMDFVSSCTLMPQSKFVLLNFITTLIYFESFSMTICDNLSQIMSLIWNFIIVCWNIHT